MVKPKGRNKERLSGLQCHIYLRIGRGGERVYEDLGFARARMRVRKDAQRHVCIGSPHAETLTSVYLHKNVVEHIVMCLGGRSVAAHPQ